MALEPGLYARLPTEKHNPKSLGLDLKSALAVVRLINSEDARVPAAVGREAPRIAAAAELIAASFASGGTLLLVGAGTSGRLAVLEAAECPPTFHTPPRQIRAAMAGGRGAVFRSREGAEDDPKAGAAAVKGLGRRDVVIGIAASGVTPYVRGALSRARALGCKTVLVTSNSRPGRAADVVIAPMVGPEIVAGSTRMKCGTAAKLVLNSITTAAMVRLGKVHDHWMVDVKPNSRKLRLRAGRMVAGLGRVETARAEALLAASGGRVKEAVMMARLGLSAPAARRALAAKGGSLRRALGGPR